LTGLTYLAYSNSNSGAPGFYQASQMVSGNGYNTDPQFPFNKPPGRWGGLALTTGVSLILLNRMADYFNDVQDVKGCGGGWRFSQKFNNWPTTSGVTINKSVYTQSVSFSLNTGQPSYSGPATNGANSNYASQTYRTPSGAVIDWGGNIVV